MRYNSPRTCLFVFDTNSLFRDLSKKGDFTQFELPKNYSELISILSEYKIEKHVDVGIPAVVWRELERQTIDFYAERKEIIEKHFNSFIMPFHQISIKEGDYRDYLQSIIKKTKNKLGNGNCNVIEIPLPKSTSFHSLMERAFNKQAPFSGERGKSDKGFKDALLWESLLESIEDNEYKTVALFTRDQGFDNDGLRKEIELRFPKVRFSIVRNIEDAEIVLRRIAKEIYGGEVQLPKLFRLLDKAKEWAKTGAFRTTVSEYDSFDYLASQFGKPLEFNKRIISVETVEYDGTTIEEDVFIVKCIFSINYRFGENAPYIAIHKNGKVFISRKIGNTDAFTIDGIEI